MMDMRSLIDMITEARIDKGMFKPETIKKVTAMAQDRFDSQKPNFTVLGEIQDRDGALFKVWGRDEGGDVRLYAGNAEDRCVGYILLRQLSPDWPEMKQISMAFVLPKFTKRGIAKALYMFALNKGYVLVSDGELTTASRAIWQSLMNDHKVSVTMTRDINDMHEEPLRDIKAAFRDREFRMIARIANSSTGISEGYHDGDEMDYEQAAYDLIRKVKVFAENLPITVEMLPYERHGTVQGVVLTDLYADQPGNGAGTKVMNFMCHLAYEDGLSIYTDAEGPQSKQFYEKFGFERSNPTQTGHYLQKLAPLPRSYFDD